MQKEVIFRSFVYSSQSCSSMLAFSLFLCLYFEPSFWNKRHGSKSTASPQFLRWLRIHRSMTETGMYPSLLLVQSERMAAEQDRSRIRSFLFPLPCTMLSGASFFTGNGWKWCSPTASSACASSTMAVQTGCIIKQKHDLLAGNCPRVGQLSSSCLACCTGSACRFTSTGIA